MVATIRTQLPRTPQPPRASPHQQVPAQAQLYQPQHRLYLHSLLQHLRCRRQRARQLVVLEQLIQDFRGSLVIMECYLQVTLILIRRRVPGPSLARRALIRIPLVQQASVQQAPSYRVRAHHK